MTHGVTMPAAAGASDPSNGGTHFATGKNRGDTYSLMMALMMGKLLGSNSLETKAQKQEEKENFLKEAIETAMEQIQDFGQLEEWLNQLQQNDQGYSPAMQAWIKNEASQMANFKDKNAQTAINNAKQNIKTDLSNVKAEESAVVQAEHSVASIEDAIATTEKKFKSAVNTVETKFDNEIKYLKSKLVETHWYEPWTYIEDAGIYVAIGLSYAAEGIALGSLYTGEGLALAGLYTALGVCKLAVLTRTALLKKDKEQLHKDQGKLAQAENGFRSDQNNLMGILENNGKSQGDSAKAGLQTYKSQQSKIQAIDSTLESLLGDISQNASQPSIKSSH